MLRIRLTTDAEKFKKKLGAKQQRQIAKKLLELCVNPRPNDSQPLKGNLVPFWRADVGEFRIIYCVEDTDTLYVSVIGNRNDDDAYKKARRMNH